MDSTAPQEPTISYSKNLYTLILNEAVNTIIPSLTGDYSSISISPSLPSGLSIDPSNGTISGTPTTISTLTTYTVTINNSSSASYSIQIRVINGIKVNSTSGGNDANPGDGVCETAASNGICTLQAAIQEVSGGTSKEIYLPTGIYTISSRPVLSNSTTIYGDGVTSSFIDGGNLSGLIQVDSSIASTAVTFSLKDLTMQNGTHTGGGAALSLTGDISKPLTVYASNVDFVGNSATTLGGAIYIGSYTTFNGSRIKLINNTASSGGAIYTPSGTLNITDCLIDSNTASTSTGGFFLLGSNTHEIDRCLFKSNSGADGGAIYFNGPTVNVKNSTFTQNSSSTGGAIFASSGTINIQSATIAYNNTTGVNTGGGIRNNGAFVNLINSIVHENIDSTVSTDNCVGTISSGTGSFENINQCATDNPNTDPILSTSLELNGGFTATLSLSPTSPARDAGLSSCSSYDQRNHSRDSSCDAGAFEFQP